MAITMWTKNYQEWIDTVNELTCNPLYITMKQFDEIGQKAARLMKARRYNKVVEKNGYEPLDETKMSVDKYIEESEKNMKDGDLLI